MRTIAENANDFVDLRTADGGNCVYVDKTDYFHRLVTAGSKKLFFIARPRRFGKSLMITTFKYIFEGRRELFKGLKIDKTDYDWKVHPVIHIDFGNCAAATYAGFVSLLPNVMRLALEVEAVLYDMRTSEKPISRYFFGPRYGLSDYESHGRAPASFARRCKHGAYRSNRCSREGSAVG